MLNYLRVLIFFIIIILYDSCKKDNVLYEYINIENDLELSLSQNVAKEGPHFELIISTVDSTYCLDSRLISNSYLDQNILNINVEGLSDNECLSGISKPESILKLNPFLTELAFKIGVKNAFKTSGKLIKKEQKVVLNLEESNGIKTNVISMNTIDENTFFGKIESTDENDISAFLELLDNNKEITFTAKEGNYGLFNVSNGIVHFPNYNLHPTNKTFYLKYTNWNILKNSINDFIATHPNFKISASNSFNLRIEN